MRHAYTRYGRNCQFRVIMHPETTHITFQWHKVAKSDSTTGYYVTNTVGMVSNTTNFNELKNEIYMRIWWAQLVKAACFPCNTDRTISPASELRVENKVGLYNQDRGKVIAISRVFIFMTPTSVPVKSQVITYTYIVCACLLVYNKTKQKSGMSRHWWAYHRLSLKIMITSRTIAFIYAIKYDVWRTHTSIMMTSSNENIFLRYWPFVWGIHRSTVNSPHKGQWRGALMFTLICARIKGLVNNREAGDLRHNRARCDVIVMYMSWAMGLWIACGEMVRW